MFGLITAHCRQCNTDVDIAVMEGDFEKWQMGELIQDAMPYLTPDEREILISGTCGPCFDKMFGENWD